MGRNAKYTIGSIFLGAIMFLESWWNDNNKIFFMLGFIFVTLALIFNITIRDKLDWEIERNKEFKVNKLIGKLESKYGN